MIHYKSIYTEKYDKTDVEKLKKTFGLYLKNIRNISTPKELKIVYDSYVEFHNNTKHTLLNRLNLNYSKYSNNIYKIYPPFLFFTDLSDSYYLNQDNLDHFYRIWNKSRNKSYSLLQRYSKKIIDDLNSIHYIQDKEVIYVENLYGVKITTIGEEIPIKREQDIVKDIHYDLHNTKDNVKKAITLIKEKGLGKVLSGLNIVLDFRMLYIQNRSIDREGQYDNKSDTISIFNDLYNDNIYTIIHEIGHRFDYKIIGKAGQEEWEVFVKSLGEGYAVTEYSKTNSREMWAEVFTLYVLGKQIPNILESKFKYFASLK